MSEGGNIINHTGVHAPSPDVTHDPNAAVDSDRASLQSYLSILGAWNPFARKYFESSLKHTSSLSTRETATFMRDQSDKIWAQNGEHTSIPIQHRFNNYLWTHNDDEGKTLNHIKSDMLTPLFAQGDEKNWPQLILTSNHARAWQSNDLHELMQGVVRIASDSGDAPIDTCRLTQTTPKEEAAGKTIVVMAVHTEKDILLNGANLIDRRLDLEKDSKITDPANRTLEHISPAAMRLAKLMVKLMVVPESQQLIDLDRASTDNNHKLKAEPFIADHMAHNAHEDYAYIEENPIILRADATKIAQHLKLIGYSKGANVATDALRFFYQECKHLGAQLKVRDVKGELREATDADIKSIISSIALMSIAPGEVPLTKAEKEILGMRRTTILNTHDLTAGHLVNPDSHEYDPISDKLIQIEGTKAESGHSITDALGNHAVGGYIMNPANKDKPHYAEAQQALREFFATNHQYTQPENTVLASGREIVLAIGACPAR